MVCHCVELSGECRDISGVSVGNSASECREPRLQSVGASECRELGVRDDRVSTDGAAGREAATLLPATHAQLVEAVAAWELPTLVGGGVVLPADDALLQRGCTADQRRRGCGTSAVGDVPGPGVEDERGDLGHDLGAGQAAQGAAVLRAVRLQVGQHVHLPPARGLDLVHHAAERRLRRLLSGVGGGRGQLLGGGGWSPHGRPNRRQY